MKHLFLILTLISLASAHPPKVRLLSASDNSALIRVDDGATESKLNTLVHTLRSAGVLSFVFETTDDRLLTKLKPTWLDSGIKSITIKEPQPLSAPVFPKLGPLEALATLQKIDDELDKVTANFEANRKILTTLISRHGIPEYQADTTHKDLTQNKKSTEELLAKFLTSSSTDQFTIASNIDLPGNPVTKHLEVHQLAQEKSRKLIASGIGPNHPAIKVVKEEISTSLQLATEELSAIEEALRVKIYRLGKQARHFNEWQKLFAPEKEALRTSYRNARSEYETSLKNLRQISAMKRAAQKSVPAPE